MITSLREAAAERLLDVRDLEPCEPMERVLEAVHALQAGEYIRMVHRMEPRLLYPMLEQLGMAWHTRIGTPVEVLIHRRDDATAAAAVACFLAADG